MNLVTRIVGKRRVSARVPQEDPGNIPPIFPEVARRILNILAILMVTGALAVAALLVRLSFQPGAGW